MHSFSQICTSKNQTMIRKVLSVVIIMAVFTTQAEAQALGSTYRTAVGVKIYPGAISVKHFTRNDVALEALASFWRYGFRFTGLYEFHGNINGAEGLKWYIGPGAHVGFYNDRWRRRYDEREDEIDIGVDGVLGLDYKFRGAPINVSIDWQPSFTILEDTYFRSWGGLGVRFAF